MGRRARGQEACADAGAAEAAERGQRPQCRRVATEQAGQIAGSNRAVPHGPDLYRQAYPRDKYPQGHPTLATSLNNLGMLLKTQTEVGQAEALLRQALQTWQRLFPRDTYPQGHADVAQSLNNLGRLLQGQVIGTRPSRSAAKRLEMRMALYPRSKFPQGHPSLALSLNNMGSRCGPRRSTARRSRCCAMLAMRQRAVSQGKYPQGHSELAQSLEQPGWGAPVPGGARPGRAAAVPALDMIRRFIPGKIFPGPSAAGDGSLNTLGFVLQEQGEYARAEPLGEALEMRHAHPRSTHPYGHRQLASSPHNLGRLLQAQAEYGQAEPLLRQAPEMYQTLYPRERSPGPSAAGDRSQLGMLLQAQGEYTRAVPLLCGGA